MDSSENMGENGESGKNGEDESTTPPENISPSQLTNYALADTGPIKVKVIILGDSAVGKSKLMERYLAASYKPKQMSTHCLTLFTHETTVRGKPVLVEFWDTAGQERYAHMHTSYYFQSHACMMIFDATRKITYRNLPQWYKELRKYRPHIPVLCAVNKIDANIEVTSTAFGFVEKHKFPFYQVSAADGTNVVNLFEDAIIEAVKYKAESPDWQDEVLNMLETLSTPV